MPDSLYDQSDLLESDSGPFYRRVDWAAFWTATIVSFGVYFYTLAPTLTLEDSGELAVAGDYMGVPHPPGYPIWSLISWFFTKVFSFVPYRGQPNPAWSIGLVSAVFGGLATGVSAMLICRSGADMLTAALRWRNTGDGEATPTEGSTNKPMSVNAVCFVGSVVASLLFAFSPVMWSQAVIVEVYSLNAFFLMAILLLSYQWMCRPSNKLLYATGFLFGLGLTNYQVLLLAALTLLVVIMLRDLNLFRDFAITGAGFAICIGIMKIASEGATVGFEQHRAQTYPLDITDFATIAGLLTAMAFLAMLAIKRGIGPAAPVAIFAVLAVITLAMLLKIDNPPPYTPAPGQQVEEYRWLIKGAAFVFVLALMVVLAFTVPRGAIVAVIYISIAVSLAVLLKKGVLKSLYHPASVWFWTWITLNFVLLTVAYHFLPHGPVVALTILFAQLGVGFYIYMPIVSDGSNPPMNWGYPLTWDGFKHALTRGQYEKIAPSDVMSMRYIEQVGVYLTDLRRQFTLICAPLGFLPFAAWGWRMKNKRFRVFFVSLVLTAVAVAFVALDYVIGGQGSSAVLTKIYRTLFFVVILLSVIGLLLYVLSALKEYAFRIIGRTPSSASEIVTSVIVVLGALGAYLIIAAMLGKKLFDPGLELSLSQSFGIIILIVLPPAAVGSMIMCMIYIPDFEPDAGVRSQKWVLATLTGFMTMSLLLIALANLKGDLQDTFIQRVKFISSHGFYVLWMGYGLIFGLGFLQRILRNAPALYYCSLGGALLLAFLPIQQNAMNERLVSEMGGSEQNMHDFGWQFGNYQLRGAEGMIEELDPDEEPLPNPEFPRDMKRNAVFYGGTDPGRFVPTYMIYSAHVRPDVYLITQNALADNTFMSVTRDLYGDDIWIPSAKDNASAFTKYVDDVRSGRTQPNAALQIKDGKVSVHGVAGVMLINGILAEMIFNHNIFRHSFYVEESYVINWMYPYLIPHGLIMQIAPGKMPKLAREMIRRDMDFWDWYARRLTSNIKFRRDVVARKSFSKLRSAIAGVYVFRRLFAEAEFAFTDSLMLYPASPEANFRLAGDVYLRTGQFRKALDTMARFKILDPNNSRVDPFVDQVNDAERTQNRIVELQNLLREGTSDPNLVLELMDLFLKIGQRQRMVTLAQNLMQNSNMPADVAFKIAQKFEGAKMYKEMDTALQLTLSRSQGQMPPQNLLVLAQMYANGRMMGRAIQILEAYTTARPDDFQVRIHLAAAYLNTGQRPKCMAQLKQVVNIGGNQARQAMQRDPRLRPLQNDPQFQALIRVVPGAATPFTLPGQFNVPNS
jgi:tetratricopeptide (TPR) repeat protein